MTYLLNRLPAEAGGHQLYRFSVDPRDAQRWDPPTRTWTDLPWPNKIGDELSRGSYGMSTPTLADVIAITGGRP
jgi:hypothetical protein